MCYSELKMSAVYLLLMLAVIPQWSMCQQGVYFVEKAPVYITYDSWIVTLTIDLAPFEDNFATIKREIDEFHNEFKVLLEGSNRTTSTRHKETLLSLLHNQMTSFDFEFQDLITRYNYLNSLTISQNSNRQKRGLFPFGGKILNYLFSVPTHNNLKQLQRAISQTKNTQSKIIDVVENSVSIINTTHDQVRENRNIIITLQNLTQLFYKELSYFRTQTRGYLSNSVYLMLISRLDNLFHVINPKILRVKLDLNEIINNVQDCIQGNLPVTLLPPVQLQTLLDQIAKQLPTGFQLPHGLKYIETMNYYKFLHPLTVLEEGQIHVLIALPLLPHKEAFRVFEAVSMPFNDPVLNLSAEYKLESTHFAVSYDKRFYSFLSSNEMKFCHEALICKLHTPLFYTGTYPTCMISLYLRNTRATQENCKIKILDAFRLPQIKYLDFGHWVLSSPFPLRIYVTCLNSEYIRLIETGITTLTLQPGCKAKSDYFQIPIYQKGNTDTTKEITLEAEININRLSSNIWNISDPLRKFMEQDVVFNKTQKHLDLISELPLRHLQNLLQDAKRTNNDASFSVTEAPTSIKIITSILLTLVMVYIMYRLFMRIKPIKIITSLRQTRRPKQPRTLIENNPQNRNTDEVIEMTSISSPDHQQEPSQSTQNHPLLDRFRPVENT